MRNIAAKWRVGHIEQVAAPLTTDRSAMVSELKKQRKNIIKKFLIR